MAAAAEAGRPTAPGVFSRLLAVERPAEIAARRVLRPGAPAAIVDWKRGDSVFEGVRHGPPDERRVEPSAARRALEAAGFTAIRQLDTLPLHFFLVGRAG
mgnify:CR=1 FL=1